MHALINQTIIQHSSNNKARRLFQCVPSGGIRIERVDTGMVHAHPVEVRSNDRGQCRGARQWVHVLKPNHDLAAIAKHAHAKKNSISFNTNFYEQHVRT